MWLPINHKVILSLVCLPRTVWIKFSRNWPSHVDVVVAASSGEQNSREFRQVCVWENITICGCQIWSDQTDTIKVDLLNAIYPREIEKSTPPESRDGAKSGSSFAKVAASLAKPIWSRRASQLFSTRVIIDNHEPQFEVIQSRLINSGEARRGDPSMVVWNIEIINRKDVYLC